MEASMTPELDNGAANLNRATSIQRISKALRYESRERERAPDARSDRERSPDAWQTVRIGRGDMLPRSGEAGRNELPALPSHCGTGDSRPLHYDDVPGESAFALQSRVRSGLVDFLRPRRSTLRSKRDRHPCEDDRGLRRREPSRLRCTPGRC